MPKDSCVTHKRGYYLEFRRDYSDLFDGDHCCAILAAFFEFGTNGELARMRLANEDGEPWVKASMPSIFEETLGFYSIRRLQGRIDFLESSKIIKVSERSGKIRKYLLDSDRLTSLLASGSVISPENPGHLSWVDRASDKASDKKTENDGALNLKEEESINQNKTPVVPLPAPRKESQTLTPKQQQTVFLSRLKHGGVKLDWRHAEKKQAIEWLEGREESFEHILTALQLFLEDEYWKGEGLPWAAFKKQFLQFLEQALAAPAPEDSGVEVPATKANPPAAAVDAPSPAQSLNWLEEWNRLVPEQPTAPNSRKQLLVTFEAAGEDFRQNFEKICETARRVILDQGTKAAYLDLYWLCKYADGESAPNWHRLLFGNLRHMAVSRGAKSVSGPWVPGQPPPQGIWNDEDEATYRAWRAERIAAGEHHDPDLFAEEQVRAAKGGKP